MSSSLTNFLPMFVPTFLLYGGSNQVIFLCLFRFSAGFLWPELFSFGLYFSLSFYPLFSRAAWYSFAALLKICSFDEIADNLLLIFSGMFLMMFGGWLLSLCTYKGTLLGLM